MPNWKKVITSGSNAAFNSVIASNGFTGSFTGSFNGNLIGTASVSEVSRRIRVGVSGNLLNPPDDDYYVLMMRETLVGAIDTTVLTTTSSMVYSASLGLLYVTASYAQTASFAITASYAANAAPTPPQGSTNEIQYNAGGGAFGGVSTLTYDGADLIGTGSFTGRFDGNLRLGLYRGAQTNITIASAADEVLIYTHYIPSGTFTDNDAIRVRWRTYNSSKNSPEYYIYMADTSDFNTISGSSSNIIAFCTASNNTISYLQMKRDFSLNATDGTLDYITANLPLITDDTLLVNATPIKTFVMDWANTDYWMFFSAKPNSVVSSCVSKYCTVERV